MAFGITKKEIKLRGGYILLGFFAALMVEPLKDLINGSSPNPLIIGVVGIILTLFFFDFAK